MPRVATPNETTRRRERLIDQAVAAGVMTREGAPAVRALYNRDPAGETRRMAALIVPPQVRAQALDQAVREGRFAEGRRAHYAAAFDSDPQGTLRLLTASVDDGGLAPLLAPVNAEAVHDGRLVPERRAAAAGPGLDAVIEEASRTGEVPADPTPDGAFPWFGSLPNNPQAVASAARERRRERQVETVANGGMLTGEDVPLTPDEAQSIAREALDLRAAWARGER